MNNITIDGQNKNLLEIVEEILQTLNLIRPYIQGSEECFIIYSCLTMSLSSIQVGLEVNIIPVEIIQHFLIDCINNAKSVRRQSYKARKTKGMNLTPTQIKFLWQVSYFGGTLKNLDYSTKGIFSQVKQLDKKLRKLLNKLII